MPINDNELYLALGRVEGKLDQLLAANAKTDAKVEKIEARVTKLEQSKFFFMGVVGTVSALVSYIITYMKS